MKHNLNSSTKIKYSILVIEMLLKFLLMAFAINFNAEARYLNVNFKDNGGHAQDYIYGNHYIYLHV